MSKSVQEMVGKINQKILKILYKKKKTQMILIIK